jgi:tRNA A-37 threonylcarbamoyl transferase component Bud32
MNEQAIFLAALDKDPAERAAFLDEACGGDTTLRGGVETLLRLHAEAHGFLDVPAPEQLAATDPGPGNAAADLSFLAPPSEPGSLGRLGHYEALEVVGRGGTGVVLRARDTKLLRVVAIKALAAPLAASGTARQRFAREARAAAAVRDDHVVAIHAVCDDAPVPYLVMEFIDGCNLEALIRGGGPLEVKEVLRIGIQVARGLAAAHKHGLIHRDVKPANILLENGVQRVKLSDFGLARTVDDASLTQSGIIAGTPAYMSPEQANGARVDHRSDLFSLGSVVYEMCTGRPAFRAPTAMAVLRRVCDEAPRPVREVNPDVPEPLCRLIERLHAKKPDDRPASATEVADLLTRLLADLNSGSSRPAEGTPVRQGPARQAGPTRRRWRWVAAALVLLVATLGLGEATGVTDVCGTVVRLFSPEGTLVVEVDDPGVSVTVDGADVVITGAGAKEIRLKPGQYKVQASKDGKVVRQELVSVSRNGRQVVRISKESVPFSGGAEAWEKYVAGLPPEQQVEAVAKRLQELNPGFDGKATHTVVDGRVTQLGVFTHAVKDLSPLRALPHLESLGCAGTLHSPGKVTDLSPLRGLPLKRLHCEDNPVSDLSPLKGMPLEVLVCYRTQVENLSPLKGMPLTALNATGTRIADLSPLKGMKLTLLLLQGAPVSDLSPLRGVRVEKLDVSRTRVTDLSPLKGMKLQHLDIHLTGVTDLSPLKGMSLTQLQCDFQRERDGEVLRSLTALERINGKTAADFWKEVAGE